MQETLHLSSSSATTPLPSGLHYPNLPSTPRPYTPNFLHIPPSLPPSSRRLITRLYPFLRKLPKFNKPSSTWTPSASTPSTASTPSVPPPTNLHSHFPYPISRRFPSLSLGLTVHDLRRIFPMCPDLLTSSTVIRATTFLLREARVGAADLRYAIHRRPRLLTCSIERHLRPTLYFLQGTIGIEDVTRFTFLLSCSVVSKFIPRIEYLQKLGFSYWDTIVMFRRFPPLFCYSIKENFEPKFDYFVVEMGRDLKELVAFPHYFSFSLENRIKPRHIVCVEKGVCLALPTMLKVSEARMEVCCSSSAPVRTSPLWSTSINTHGDDVT